MAEFKDLREGELAHSRAAKFKSFKAADFGEPNVGMEEYRFTPLERFQGLLNGKYAAQNTSTVKVWDVLLADGEIVTFDTAGNRSENGPVSVALRKHSATNQGLVGQPTDVFAALAWENAPSVLEVKIAAEAELSKPMLVQLAAQSVDAEAQQVRIETGPASQAQIIIEHIGHALLTEGVEILSGDGSQLNVLSLHKYDFESVHASNYRMRVGRDAHFKHTVVSLGGGAVRVIPEIDYAGPGGEVELLGLYLTDTGQHHEHRLFVHHNQPNCKSNVNYKGALHGQNNHAVWIGDVLIDTPADGTDSYEQNRNLVLNLGPKVDSVPNLEIANGNIEGAGHASATMRFDEEQLFYLRSRGIALAEARRMVVNGFFAELIGQIGMEQAQEEILELVHEELNRGEF